MRQLVVGVDGSAPSQMAYHWASALVSAAGARITVGHVVDLSSERHERGRAEVADAEQAEWVAALKTMGIDCSSRLLCGDPPGRLLDLATQVSADMIVILTHATSRYTVAHATCRVVLVPVEPIPSSERKVASNG